MRLVVGGAESETTLVETVRSGGVAAPGADYRIVAQNTQFDLLQILGGISPSRGWVSDSGDYCRDWDISSRYTWWVSRGVYQRVLALADTAISSPNAPPGDDRNATTGENVAVRWPYIVSETSSIEVCLSYDHLLQDDPQSPSTFNPLMYGFQRPVHVGRIHDVIYGFSFRNAFHGPPSRALRFSPLHDDCDVIALFAEDEISLIPDKLHFIVGTQASHIENFGCAIQPTVRLPWSPAESLSSWIAVTRVVRTPSPSETGLDVYQARVAIPPGSPLIPSLLAVEHIVGNRLSAPKPCWPTRPTSACKL